jgi:hypothetical protein
LLAGEASLGSTDTTACSFALSGPHIHLTGPTAGCRQRPSAGQPPCPAAGASGHSWTAAARANQHNLLLRGCQARAAHCRGSCHVLLHLLRSVLLCASCAAAVLAGRTRSSCWDAIRLPVRYNCCCRCHRWRRCWPARPAAPAGRAPSQKRSGRQPAAASSAADTVCPLPAPPQQAAAAASAGSQAVPAGWPAPPRPPAPPRTGAGIAERAPPCAAC